MRTDEKEIRRALLVEEDIVPPSKRHDNRVWYTVGAVAILVATAVLVALGMKGVHHGSGSDSNTVTSMKKDSYKDNSQYEYSQAKVNRSWIFSVVNYCDNVNEIKNWTCGHCKNLPGVQDVAVADADNEFSLFGYVAYDSEYNQLVLSFRGSEMQNYFDYHWQNLMVPYYDQDACDGGQVYKGFQEAWLDMQDYIIPLVEDKIAAYPDIPIMITGHSLGGALASFAAFEVKGYLDSIEDTREIWFNSFGMPRWLNRDMRQCWQDRISYTYRVVYLHDAVPKLPPALLNYVHTGIEIWYYCNQPLSYHQCRETKDENGENTKCSNRFPLGWVPDHFGYYEYSSLCESSSSPRSKLPEMPEIPTTFCNPLDAQYETTQSSS